MTPVISVHCWCIYLAAGHGQWKNCISYLFIASSELCCLSLTMFQKQVHGEQSYLPYPSPLITIIFFLIFCFQFFSLYLYPWSYAGFDSLKTKKRRCSAERKNCFFFLFALFLSIRVLYYPLTVNTMSPLQKTGLFCLAFAGIRTS